MSEKLETTVKLVNEGMEINKSMGVLTEDVMFTMERIKKITKVTNKTEAKEMRMCIQRVKMNIQEMNRLDNKWEELRVRINEHMGKEVVKKNNIEMPDVSLIITLEEGLKILEKDIEENEQSDKWKSGE